MMVLPYSTFLLSPQLWNQNLPGNRRNASFVLEELMGDEVDGGSGHLGATVVDSGPINHVCVPFVHNQSNVLWNSHQESSGEPIRDMSMERDDDRVGGDRNPSTQHKPSDHGESMLLVGSTTHHFDDTGGGRGNRRQ
ncbi:MAG: hypothetical protein B9S32_16540 [Verrucomicrobia bacterium Tous-C9LFEB]|nr:MAG: hypothetical protein B9S32_16540 [Verrucomicrobia bacterium Tous-C9LFEB]